MAAPLHRRQGLPGDAGARLPDERRFQNGRRNPFPFHRQQHPLRHHLGAAPACVRALRLRDPVGNGLANLRTERIVPRPEGAILAQELLEFG